jgi:hypothetical protein
MSQARSKMTIPRGAGGAHTAKGAPAGNASCAAWGTLRKIRQKGMTSSPGATVHQPTVGSPSLGQRCFRPGWGRSARP